MSPVLPVVLPLFAAALVAALTKLISQRASQIIAVGVTLVTLADLVYLLHASATQPIVYWFGNWRPRNGIALGIAFVVDPVGSGLAAFAAFLTLAALIFSSSYFDTVGNHFHALMLAFLAALCGFSLTGDIFNLFVFFELMSAAAFALCGYKTDDPGSLQGAFNFAVTNTIAAYFVLIGIAVLYARTGALNMAQIGRVLQTGRVDSLVVVGFVFLVCGYLVKAAIVPFHFWLADAHAVAPTPVCILFSGVMVEMGVFALARIYWTIFQGALQPHLHGMMVLFTSIGAVTAIMGAFMCYLQRNLKRLLAFSTISHVGLMTIGVGLLAPAGLAGAAVYALGHGMVKAALFLVAGILLHRFELVDERDLHGKARGQWWTGAIFCAGALALAGFPGSGLAAGHDLMDISMKDCGVAWLRWIFVLADSVTAAAVLRAGGHVFLGWGNVQPPDDPPRQSEKPDTKSGHDRTPGTMFVPAAVLVLAGMLLGFVPGLNSAAIAGAAHFENTASYTAHVLDSAPMPPGIVAVRPSRNILSGILSILAAVLIACFDLFSSRVHQLAARFARLLHIVHRLHSGHVGDYVAFITFGFACFGLLFAYCFR